MPLITLEIPSDLSPESLFGELKTYKDSSLAKTAIKIHNLVKTNLKGIILYRSIPVKTVHVSGIELENIFFHSPTLGSLFEKGWTAYPNIITCKGDTNGLTDPNDLMQEFCLETIKTMILKKTINAFQNHLVSPDGYPLSFAHPGSMRDWDISDLRQIFHLLDIDPETGPVRLTRGNVMIPLKTTAGIAFHSPRHFINCTSCDRADCPERHAPYKGASVDKGRQSWHIS